MIGPTLKNRFRVRLQMSIGMIRASDQTAKKMLHQVPWPHPFVCVHDNQETPSGVECHLQLTIYTSHTTINPLLHCAASNTVDSQCLQISISMSVNTIPLSLQRN